MIYEHFLKAIFTHKKASEDIAELDAMGFNFYEGKYRLSDHLESLLTILLESHYTEEGVEWVEWFIYEADYGTKDFSSAPLYEKNEDGKFILVNEEGEVRWGARDKNGEPICYSYESLYNYIEQYKHKN
jgi:hypothetical protein